MAVLKIFHVTGFVLWIGALMMMTRVLAFQAGEPPPVQERLAVLVRKMNLGGAVPGFVLVFLTGVIMLAKLHWTPLQVPVSGPGFHLKLTFVALLAVAHWFTARHARALAEQLRPVPAKPFKVLHGAVGALFLGVLASLFVAYHAG